jgi:Fur family transcriptional regulator, iron response regulator
MIEQKIYIEKSRYANLLKEANLRPTQQRLMLISSIFKYGNRHINAEELHKEISLKGGQVSLATVYNTLNHLTNVGLLRQVRFNSNQNYFDTNTSSHHHFFDKSNHTLIDIPHDEVKLKGIPKPPPNKKISDVEIIISIKNK